MIRTILVVLIVLHGAGPHAVAQTPAVEARGDLAGIYKVEGESYRGTVAIRKNGDSYALTWTIGPEVHHGIGIQQGTLLASSWSGGVVVYEIGTGRHLSGRYAVGDGILRQETLTYLRPLPVLPPPQAWNVGDVLLVNWSQDEYWYSATVKQKEDERYLVVFGDGDEEWTTAERMTVDDLRAGDRVFGNWQMQGTYYPGRITQRKGRDIHIKYDDGNEEDTTIAVVRVILPRLE